VFNLCGLTIYFRAARPAILDLLVVNLIMNFIEMSTNPSPSENLMTVGVDDCTFSTQKSHIGIFQQNYRVAILISPALEQSSGSPKIGAGGVSLGGESKKMFRSHC
jgi:hypothetical protein